MKHPNRRRKSGRRRPSPSALPEAKVARLRGFLSRLPDSAGNSATGRSIDSEAESVGIEPDRLREFRDGNDAALDGSMVLAFNRLLGNGAATKGIDVDDDLADPSSNGWYRSLVAGDPRRSAKLRTYDVIDQTRPEAHSALDAWADLGVTGSVGEEGKYAGGFEPEVHKGGEDGRKLLERIAWNVNNNLLPPDRKVQVFRGVAKYGDQFGELGLDHVGGRLDVVKVAPRHARTMFHHYQKDGSVDPAQAYKQVLPNRREPVALFPAWKVVHFMNQVGWGDFYGESVFEPCLRSYIQVEAMEAAMITRRLERAALRLKHLVDIGDCTTEREIDARLKKYGARHKKHLTIDNDGNLRQQRITMPPGEDIYVPRRDKDGVADVSVLEGDGNIERIADFLHFFNKFLAGLGPPKAHLGYEGDTMRSVITDLHIVFARKVRRMQLKFIHGLNHLYWVSLLLRDVDPRSLRYTIFPPALGTRDELIRAQVQQAHATTVQYLANAFGQTGEMPSIGWFLKYVMNLDDEVIAAMDLAEVVQLKGSGMKNARQQAPQKDSVERAGASRWGTSGSPRRSAGSGCSCRCAWNRGPAPASTAGPPTCSASTSLAWSGCSASGRRNCGGQRRRPREDDRRG